MSDQSRIALKTDGAVDIESKPNLETCERPAEASSPAMRTWAWGSTREPYDWMDAHTPCHGTSSWH